MSRRCFALILAVFPTVLWAQEQCPVPITGGTWEGRQLTSVHATVTAQNFAAIYEGALDGAPMPVEIDTSACDGTFTVTTGLLIYDLTAGEEDNTYIGQSRGETYAGVALIRRMGLEPITARRISGTFSASSDLAGRGVLATSEGRFVLQKPLEATRHPACNCRAHLDAFLKDQIEKAEYWRDLYADPSLRKRPATLPPSNRWRFFDEYEPFLDLVSEAGLEGAFLLVSGGFRPNGDLRVLEGVEIKDADGNDLNENDGATLSLEKVGSALAAVEQEFCEIEYYFDKKENAEYISACYRDLQYEAVTVHEMVHRAACLDRNRRAEASRYVVSEAEEELDDVDVMADEEVRAHNAEIAWLRAWPNENCGG